MDCDINSQFLPLGITLIGGFSDDIQTQPFRDPSKEIKCVLHEFSLFYCREI